ncbi:MAG: GSCFA domain-containing protein [Ideonella sp.]|nr:GSCFA domain-containing protein [Ideonella sp.]
MHTINHARLFALADLARAALARSGLEATTPEGPDYLADRLALRPVLPVYPEIAHRLGLRGGLNFKLAQRGGAGPARFIDLEEFVACSFAIYARHAPGSITCERLLTPPYRELLAAPRIGARPAPHANPYAGLPAHRFWKRAVQQVAAAEVDPAIGTGFSFDEQAKIGTAGSCFAQHIARRLGQAGYRHHVTEAAPAGIDAAEAARRNYGVYSARYGNIYTARQLAQLMAMARGRFEPNDKAWLRADGRFVDPFRPLVEPDGFASAAAVQAGRAAHLARVKDLFEALDVFVFTLGLTECWRSKVDGAVFPLAPGVAAQPSDGADCEFVNFPVAEVTADLESFVADLAEINAGARVILTVSPVPLVATYEDRHVLTASAYSKAVLRAAADEVVQRHAQVHYFPSYEIITGAFNRGAYFDADLRSVTEQGIDHVMRVFLRHYGRGRAQDPQAPRPPGIDAEARALLDIVCDEDALDPSRP